MLRTGTSATIQEYTDGNIHVYVTNASPIIIRIPKWFSLVEKDNLLKSIKDQVESAARRISLEEIKNG